MRKRIQDGLVLLLCGVAVTLFVQAIWNTSESPAKAQTATEPDARQAAAPALPPVDLLPAEMHTVRLFETASPAIVNVDVTQRRVDPWSRRSVDVPAGSGSGFLWDDQGHVVTNFHVIRNASSAMVTLDDQTQLPAELVGVSPDHDLAVLKIKPHDGDDPSPTAALRGLPIGSSATLLVGQNVYAIGNPFGLDHTLTTGVVSALDREIQSLTGRTLDGVVQTDAAINPGNSGGPLLDSAGRVIGVNTMIFSPSGASAGVGFAIPIDTVKRVVPQLINHGEYTRPTLGIRLDDRATASILKRLNKRGILVLGVEPGSPAEAAGLRATTRRSNGDLALGDLLLAVNQQPVENYDDLLNALERSGPGSRVTLTVWREKLDVEIEVDLR